MPSKATLLDMQRKWATRTGANIDARGYVSSIAENLYQPLSVRATRAFSTGNGSELLDNTLRPAKMKALHSSAALAVNIFDYWADRHPDVLLRALGLEVKPVSIEFEAQFPTGLDGNPPNLDVAFRFGGRLVVGVESKFSEWLTPKSPNKELFKPKYFPEATGLWSNKGLPTCQALATEVHAGTTQFRYLDVAQLLKHALGLATQHPGAFELYYLFFEWEGPESLVHRAEVERFQKLIGSDFRFQWSSYQEIYKLLGDAIGDEHALYATYLRDRYFDASRKGNTTCLKDLKGRNICIHSAPTKVAVMSPIKSYTVKNTPISLSDTEYDKYRPFGGYDEVKKAYTPLRFGEISDELEGSGSQVNYALDSITLAMEAGIFKDSDTFIAKAFATTEDAAEFVEALRDHEYYWLNERHFYAFSHALNCDESQMRTYPEIADLIASEI